jgi:phage gp29-like protein
MVRNLRRDEQEGVVLPGAVNDAGELKPLAQLELLASSGARQFDTSAIISRYSREIAVALLQDIVLLGHEKVGTQALASEKRDLSDTALQAWLNTLAAVLNTHAVPRLFALNGESLENLPVLQPGELRPTDVEEFAAALKDISTAGFTFTGDEDVEATIRRRLGLPPGNPERLDEEEPPEPIFDPEQETLPMGENGAGP